MDTDKFGLTLAYLGCFLLTILFFLHFGWGISLFDETLLSCGTIACMVITYKIFRH